MRYGRDATGRIVARTEAGAVTRYGHAGPGDSSSFTLTATNAPLERTVGLAGGIPLTRRAGLLGANDVWSYPNVHGDVVAIANTAGLKLGATMSYDPFGVALATLPDNSPGDFDYGWPGPPPVGRPRGGWVGERLRLLLGRPDQLSRHRWDVRSPSKLVVHHSRRLRLRRRLNRGKSGKKTKP